jgi:hypothetical protein
MAHGMTGQSSLPSYVVIGGTSVEGLHSGTPRLVPALEKGDLMTKVEEAEQVMTRVIS